MSPFVQTNFNPCYQGRGWSYFPYQSGSPYQYDYTNKCYDPCGYSYYGKSVPCYNPCLKEESIVDVDSFPNGIYLCHKSWKRGSYPSCTSYPQKCYYPPPYYSQKPWYSPYYPQSPWCPTYYPPSSWCPTYYPQRHYYPIVHYGCPMSCNPCEA